MTTCSSRSSATRTRDDLDHGSTTLPVVRARQSGHLAVMNSKAPEIVGCSAASKNPIGGASAIKAPKQAAAPSGCADSEACFKVASPVLNESGVIDVHAPWD